MTSTLEFCGETHGLNPDGAFLIGRFGDLSIEDNPYLHRRFLRLDHSRGLWWIANVGTQLSATISDTDGRFHAWLSPGGLVPLVFPEATVWFTAGPTTYEMTIRTDHAAFDPSIGDNGGIGATTGRPSPLTVEQHLLLVALAEPILRRQSSQVAVPSSADVAARLGWRTTKLNRKLDNLCTKLARAGVRGLHGAPDRLAADRRARLVEYALAARLVRVEDLALLGAGSPDLEAVGS